MSGIDFSVRPNKSIERKLMVEFLQRLIKEFPIRKYKYIGFGSFWFIDFVLIHKRLGISKMISIERASHSDRAKFNIPLKCITVESGDSTLVLPSLPVDSNTLIWLDYDTTLSGPWKDDASIVLGSLTPGGIYIVTVNAHHGQLANRKDEDGNDLSKLDALVRDAPGLTPAGIRAADLGSRHFPIVVGQVLINLLRHLTRRANPSHSFLPIFNFRYSDNAPMVTVGGMVVDDEIERKLSMCELDRCEFLTGDEQFSIDAPPLTIKEKQALDRLLPKPIAAIRTAEVPKKLRGSLSAAEIRGYQNFYWYYPVFAEIND